MSELGRRTNAYKAADPWGTLAHAIFDRAVEDLKALRQAGVVMGWEVRKPYPKWEGKALRVNADYHMTYQVEDLLDYFLKGWSDKTLRFCENYIDPDQIKRYLEDRTNSRSVMKRYEENKHEQL
jgi:hypothetical protein